jgi:HAT1-interacting factor 1
MAPLLLSYGKALFELAVSQSGVMGKEEPKREEEDEGELHCSSRAQSRADGTDEGGPSTLIESADPEIMADAAAQAAAAAEGEEVPQEEPAQSAEGEADEEPEDDYNAAWEVLDVARTIYLRIIEDALAAVGKGKGKAAESGAGQNVEGGEEVKKAQLDLAECYQALGDISCETGTSLSSLRLGRIQLITQKTSPKPYPTTPRPWPF